jgi:hypothetical protein
MMSRRAMAGVVVAGLALAAFGRVHVQAAPATTAIGQNTVVNKAGVQSIPNRVATRVAWDIEREDSLDAFTQSDSAHLRIKDTGVYLVTLQAAWQDCTCGYRSVHLQIDGGGIVAAMPLQAHWETGESLSWQGRLQAGQTLSVWVYQDSGSSLGFGGWVRPTSSSANDELAITRIG